MMLRWFKRSNKNSNIVQIGLKCLKMVQNGSQNGSKCFKIFQNGTILFKMVQKD